MKFKEAWDKLEAKICLQRQSTEYYLLFMSLLTAQILKNLYFGRNLSYLSQNTSYTKTRSLSMPDLHLSEDIGIVVIK